jgi:ATP-dependent DNA helicase RecQ
VRTAVSWLEEAALLTRDENRVQVFPSSLRVGSVEEARVKLGRIDLFDERRGQLLGIVAALIDADPDEGISTDELMGVSGLTSEGVRAALADLEQLGIASNDTAITAFVHDGVERASRKRFEEAAALERALIEQLQEHAPDLERGQTSSLQLRVATQHLRDAGHPGALPEKIWRLIRSISMDGRDEAGGRGSLGIKRPDAETLTLELQRDWSALQKTAERRRTGAALLLDHLLACLPDGARGVDLLVETTMGKLLGALKADLLLNAESKDLGKLLDRSLLWLHEQEIIRLNKGLAVFRPAMTIRLADERRGFANPDFEPLRIHYGEQVVQVHVMAEYAQRGLSTMAEALQLTMDYFSLERSAFLERWLPDREKELARQTTPESWRQIVESLGNPMQQRIVGDDRDQRNVLVLAGPGSGKTRVLVHRIAYLLRVRREHPHGILALAYNRHAAVEIRRRLKDLVGDDARGVTVMTCHALAMRLAGVSFAVRAAAGDEAFRDVLLQAIALLKGEGLPPEEADEQRARLLAGFRWILVDEYQDIGPEQYELIAALAGRTLDDEDRRLTLFAVGDDDQNIYGFQGASVEFIRRFEADYTRSPCTSPTTIARPPTSSPPRTR